MDGVGAGMERPVSARSARSARSGARPDSAMSRRTTAKAAAGTDAPGGEGARPEQTAHRYAGNVLLHRLFCSQDFELCLRYCADIISTQQHNAEYAFFIQGLVFRRQGNFSKALASLKESSNLNPRNTMILKELARTMFFLGKHQQALEIYQDVEIFGGRDWDICHAKGVCYSLLRDYERAVSSFKDALEFTHHDSTYLQLAKVYLATERPEEAMSLLQEAVKGSPENTELLVHLGLLHLNHGSKSKAVEILQQVKKKERQDDKVSLALAAMLQEEGKIDEALEEYSRGVQRAPYSSHLWNNIGMCFFTKSKYVAAIACLKRALYLSPFDWKVAYNLGLLHIRTEQFASAFLFLNSAISLNPEHAASYSLMGLVLVQLGNLENASQAYEKSIRMNPLDPATCINYALCLFKQRRFDEAGEKMAIFDDVVAMSKETQFSELAEALRLELVRVAAESEGVA